MDVAISASRVSLVKYHCQNYPKLIYIEQSDSKDEDTQTPIQRALSRGNGEIVRVLLKYAPGLVKFRGSRGESLLHFAVRHNWYFGQAGVIRQVVWKCPVLIDAVDEAGKTAFQRAFKQSSANVQFLIGYRPALILKMTPESKRNLILKK